MRFRRKRWLWIAGLSAAAWGATGADSRIADAAEKSDWAAVRSLLHQHAGVNGAQADGSTALHWAAQRDNLEAADLLLAAGAIPSARQYSYDLHMSYEYCAAEGVPLDGAGLCLRCIQT